MLMASRTIKETSEPIGGVEYRRWLAEQGDSFVDAIEPASADEIAVFRRVGQHTPTPPERDSDFWPWARKFLERNDHARFLSTADLMSLFWSGPGSFARYWTGLLRDAEYRRFNPSKEA